MLAPAGGGAPPPPTPTVPPSPTRRARAHRRSTPRGSASRRGGGARARSGARAVRGDASVGGGGGGGGDARRGGGAARPLGRLGAAAVAAAVGGARRLRRRHGAAGAALVAAADRFHSLAAVRRHRGLVAVPGGRRTPPRRARYDTRASVASSRRAPSVLKRRRSRTTAAAGRRPSSRPLPTAALVPTEDGAPPPPPSPRAAARVGFDACRRCLLLRGGLRRWRRLGREAREDLSNVAYLRSMADAHAAAGGRRRQLKGSLWQWRRKCTEVYWLALADVHVAWRACAMLLQRWRNATRLECAARRPLPFAPPALHITRSRPAAARCSSLGLLVAERAQLRADARHLGRTLATWRRLSVPLRPALAFRRRRHLASAVDALQFTVARQAAALPADMLDAADRTAARRAIRRALGRWVRARRAAALATLALRHVLASAEGRALRGWADATAHRRLAKRAARWAAARRVRVALSRWWLEAATWRRRWLGGGPRVRRAAAALALPARTLRRWRLGNGSGAARGGSSGMPRAARRRRGVAVARHWRGARATAAARSIGNHADCIRALSRWVVAARIARAEAAARNPKIRTVYARGRALRLLEQHAQWRRAVARKLAVAALRRRWRAIHRWREAATLRAERRMLHMGAIRLATGARALRAWVCRDERRVIADRAGAAVRCRPPWATGAPPRPPRTS